MSSQIEEWEEHNEGWRYDPPDGPSSRWSQEEWQEVIDRVINLQTTWTCEMGGCTGKTYSSLRKARQHVESQHAQELAEEYGEAEQ